MHCRWGKAERWDTAKVLESELLQRPRYKGQADSAPSQTSAATTRLNDPLPGRVGAPERITPSVLFPKSLEDVRETLIPKPTAVTAAEGEAGDAAQAWLRGWPNTPQPASDSRLTSR